MTPHQAQPSPIDTSPQEIADASNTREGSMPATGSQPAQSPRLKVVRPGQTPLAGLRPVEPDQSHNEFPSTKYTYIESMLEDGPTGRINAAKHVMTVYREPLRVYFVGSSFRSLGDAEEYVHGFFASRLQRDLFFHDWLNSKRQLRYWLITAFRHYLYECIRDTKKHRGQELPDQAPTDELSSDAERAFHRSAALGIVRQAMAMAESLCEQASLQEHWRVFMRHHVDGRSYEELRDEFGLDEKRFKVMSRTAGNKLKAALRELIRWRGASEADVDQEIRNLMEIIES